MPRIFYFCPDFPQPSGGIKTLYRHVSRLCALGFDAYIVHQKRGFTLTWHDYRVPVLWLEDRPQFEAGDIWVLPEVMVDLIRQTQRLPVRKIVLALSWAPAYNRLRPGERWQDLGVEQVLTKSALIKRYLEWSMALAVTLIPEAIDATRYRYEPAAKLRQIAYLTRKDASAEWLQGILRRRDPALAAYSWQALRNMDEATYAQHLRSAAVFLPTTLQEGMHVSVLEAMACGALVVGFSGIGGNDYMVGGGVGQNCILVENGDLPLLGEQLEAVLLELLAHPQRYDPIIAQALQTAGRYQDPAAEEQALQAFFSGLLQ